MAPNQRKEPRRVLKYPCWILLDAPICCLLQDVSKTGAKLILTSDDELPDQFKLSMTENAKVTRDCKVVWRDGRRLGVSFVFRSLRKS
jgi:hypothetical protein